jgi:hypothetical protein
MPDTDRKEVCPMADARRRAAWLLDTGPVLILAAIAGAGSFVHIRDTAAQHGQHGPMAWAIAVCIDLTCVMAARERQRDKRTGRATRRLSWPVLVLAGGVLLSLAANLDQAQPTTWGRITAATPAAAFLVAVSMLERRTTHQPAPARVPAVLPVPDEDDRPVPVPTVPDERPMPVLRPPSARQQSARPAAPLIDFARRVAAEHQAAHGQPITRDTLRARLGVSNQLASDLLRQIRTASDTA